MTVAVCVRASVIVLTGIMATGSALAMNIFSVDGQKYTKSNGVGKVIYEQYLPMRKVADGYIESCESMGLQDIEECALYPPLKPYLDLAVDAYLKDTRSESSSTASDNIAKNRPVSETAEAGVYSSSVDKTATEHRPAAVPPSINNPTTSQSGGKATADGAKRMRELAAAQQAVRKQNELYEKQRLEKQREYERKAMIAEKVDSLMMITVKGQSYRVDQMINEHEEWREYAELCASGDAIKCTEIDTAREQLVNLLESELQQVEDAKLREEEQYQRQQQQLAQEARQREEAQKAQEIARVEAMREEQLARDSEYQTKGQAYNETWDTDWDVVEAKDKLTGERFVSAITTIETNGSNLEVSVTCHPQDPSLLNFKLVLDGGYFPVYFNRKILKCPIVDTRTIFNDEKVTTVPRCRSKEYRNVMEITLGQIEQDGVLRSHVIRNGTLAKIPIYGAAYEIPSSVGDIVVRVPMFNDKIEPVLKSCRN